MKLLSELSHVTGKLKINIISFIVFFHLIFYGLSSKPRKKIFENIFSAPTLKRERVRECIKLCFIMCLNLL